MLKKIRTVKSKVLWSTLPTVIVAFLVMAIMVSLNANNVISDEVMKKVETQAELANKKIVSHLTANQKLPIGLSKTVEAMDITSQNKGDYIELIKKMPLTNAETLGTGIFMAQKYDGAYFAPYAYKDNNTIVYTEDYFVDNTNEGWYMVADNDKDVSWTDPYYDPISGITMATAASPIRDQNKKLIGVATADLNITSIQQFVSEIRVGKEGYAILITSDGAYLSKGAESIKVNDEGVFPSILDDANASLASLGKEAISKGNGTGAFIDDNGENYVYYSKIPETGWIVLLSIAEKEIVAPVIALGTRIAIVTAVALLVLVLILVPVAKSITRPLNPLKEEISAISKGDLTREINIKSNDEIGDISKSVNQMVIDLRGTMNDILSSSSTVAATAEELEASAAQNGQAVEQVATAATEISGSNFEIAKVTQELDGVIGIVRELSQSIVSQMDVVTTSLSHVKHESGDSQKSVAQLIAVMNQVFEDVSSLSAVMDNLSDKSNQIDSIVGAIQGISTQTNLLALNASIEAARAGEAGRGFAVVADEIRKLAEQSSKSADDIAGIISEVGAVTKSANASTATVVESIGTGKDVLASVGEAFTSIVSSITEIDHLVHEADRLTNDINSNLDDANHSASRLTTLTDQSAEEAASIAAATEEQLASVEESTAATNALAQLAEELQNKIKTFKL
ncbi:methyl-accepting chemotaxis protein [Fusibacter ferrireducens]|uniref:Methyl-accepting chemotaxis protein n=1 Tax=Fusibacter ferrireducens TaxID=2785058 RepID=A0ABR9ZUN3_9FIRM|nr:methyl-accepting chemotaxis protein [Fusibacter ferrireducens]MBF4694181.1 methyl-accepting chemotaxis protein [Fusibacter ferrireducens]